MIPHKDRRCEHGTEEGGVHTNFDSYGTRRKLGLPIEEWQGICWDCWEEWGDEKSEAYRRENDAAAQRDYCGFLEAWIGHCRNPKPCEKHKDQRCWKCKEQATRNCSHAVSLVCGMPECNDHPHMEQHR